MEDDEFAVPGKPQVQLNGIGLLLPGQLHGREGIFRRVERSAPMGNNLHGPKTGGREAQ